MPLVATSGVCWVTPQYPIALARGQGSGVAASVDVFQACSAADYRALVDACCWRFLFVTLC
ncbi:hypothetical protein R84865_002308 [Carnimonas sp. R-84865]